MTLLIRPDQMERSIRHIQDNIEAAALNDTLWNSVCESLCGVLPEIRATIQARFSHNLESMPMSTFGYDQSDLNRYFDYYMNINPWSPGWFRAPNNTPLCSNEFLSKASLLRTEFYNDWQKPIGNTDAGSGLKIMHEIDRVCSIHVNYSSKYAGVYHDHMKLVFQSVGDMLRSAFKSNELILTSSVNNSTFVKSPLLERLVDPAFLVTPRRRLVKANEPATQIIKNNDTISIEASDVVRFYDQKAEVNFVSIVNDACSIIPTGAEFSEFTFTSGENRLSVTALPVAENLRSLVSRGTSLLFSPVKLALIIVRSKPVSAYAIQALLGSHYRLTAMESKLALELSYGGNLVDASSRLKLKYSTARVHTRSIYKKLGINKQRELIDMISTFYRG